MTTTASTTAVSPRDDNDGVDDGGRVTQKNWQQGWCIRPRCSRYVFLIIYS
jgi:hypothetical protein